MERPAYQASHSERGLPLEYARPTARLPLSRRLRVTVAIALICAGAGLGLSLTRPWVQRSTCGSLREVCESNMAQIGQAAVMYAHNQGGRFPDDLQTLYIAQDLTTGVFVCPASSDTRAPTAPTPQATAAGLRKPGHCSYIYLGKGLTAQTATADTVLLYEPLSNHGGDGMHVLFGDLRVEWLTPAEAQAILKQVAARTTPVRFPTTAPATAPAVPR